MIGHEGFYYRAGFFLQEYIFIYFFGPLVFEILTMTIGYPFDNFEQNETAFLKSFITDIKSKFELKKYISHQIDSALYEKS